MYAIRFQNVTKKYRLGFKKDSLRDMIPALFKKKNLNEKSKDEFFALDNVNFDIKQGEVVGIIGPNGAGKTTTLKLLSKIIKPTKGSIEVNGKMSALIEVGAGFHPDLTGRENIYLNGSILGLKRREIDKKFDKIVEFAELEKFIDTPVRHYSSGMYVRLGFSISAHIEPEIMLIDEVLSVGDMKFQMKCTKVIEELKKNGTTIIFISHNLYVVRGLCKRTILLSKGHVVEDGETEKVINTYRLRTYDMKKPGTDGKDLIKEELRDELDREAIINGIDFIDISGNIKHQFKTEDKLVIRIKYKAYKKIHNPVFGVSIWCFDGVRCYATNTSTDGILIDSIEGSGSIDIIYNKLPLLTGKYYVNAGIYEKQMITAYDYVDKMYEFEIKDDKAELGICHLEHSWKLD